MIHLLKEMVGPVVYTKCGLQLAKVNKEWTGWNDKITCPTCRPDLQEPSKCDIIIKPTTDGRVQRNKESEMANTTMIPSDQEKEEVLKLRDTEGMKWGEVAEAMGISSGKAILIYNFATLKPKDKIKDPTPADIQRFRDQEGLSWGILMARTGLSEGALRSMYEEKAGRSAKGTRVGKGGRFPGEGSDAPKEKAAAPAKKAAAPKAAAPKAAAPLKGLSSAEIKEKLTGFAVKYGEEQIAVKEVKKANQTSVVIIDSEGKGRTLKTAAVTAVSKKKVL